MIEDSHSQQDTRPIILVAPPSSYRDALALSWTQQNISFTIQEPTYHLDGELAFPPLQETSSGYRALLHFSLNNPADTLLSVLFWSKHFHVQKTGMPYLPYSRNKDISQLFLRACPQKIITFDFHDSLWIKEQEFDKKVRNVSCQEIFEPILATKLQGSPSFLFAPDRGARLRLDPLAETLGLPLISGQKIRHSNGRCTITLSQNDRAFCKSKSAYIVEDMVSSGQTLLSSVQLLQESGVSALSAFVTHTLPESQTLFASTFQKILDQVDLYVTTDLHPTPHSSKVTLIKILDRPYAFL